MGADRANKLASKLARAKHFTSNLPSLDKDLEDAQACLAELERETTAFTHDQRKSMVEAVCTFMDAEPVDPISASKNQNHAYVHECMPDRPWKKFKDKNSALGQEEKRLRPLCV